MLLSATLSQVYACVYLKMGSRSKKNLDNGKEHKNYIEKKQWEKKLMALIEKCRIRTEQFRENENPL